MVTLVVCRASLFQRPYLSLCNDVISHYTFLTKDFTIFTRYALKNAKLSNGVTQPPENIGNIFLFMRLSLYEFFLVVNNILFALT